MVGALPGQVEEAGLERQERLCRRVALAFGEEDEGAAVVECPRHLVDRVFGPRLGAAVDQHGVEDIAPDEGAQRRDQPIVEGGDRPRPGAEDRGRTVQIRTKSPFEV